MGPRRRAAPIDQPTSGAGECESGRLRRQRLKSMTNWCPGLAPTLSAAAGASARARLARCCKLASFSRDIIALSRRLPRRRRLRRPFVAASKPGAHLSLGALERKPAGWPAGLERSSKARHFQLTDRSKAGSLARRPAQLGPLEKLKLGSRYEMALSYCISARPQLATCAAGDDGRATRTCRFVLANGLCQLARPGWLSELGARFVGNLAPVAGRASE